jgi:hypothetical protein
MVFSRFLSLTIFTAAENTRHSEKPGQNPGNVQIQLKNRGVSYSDGY